MSVVDQIASALGGNIATGIADIIKLFKVDPNLALQHQVELEQIQAGLQGKILDTVTAQLEVNKQEAANSSTFVAGWRPAVGWACAAAFGYSFVLQPFLQFMLVACHSSFDPAKLPVLNWAVLSEVLLGMLGLAGCRTYEKINGVDTKQVGS